MDEYCAHSDDREMDLGDTALETVLDGILVAGEGEDPESSRDEVAELLGEEAREESEIVEASVDSLEEMSQEEMDDLMGDVYAGGRRLARVGDCILMVSPDRMKAFFRGKMPEGTTREKVAGLLEKAGIRYGVVWNRIYEVLPKKRVRHRRERERDHGEAGKREVVIAEGKPPVQVAKGGIEYCFEVVGEEEVREIKNALEGYDEERVKNCRAALPLVSCGQVLARIEPGRVENGYDVFGEEVVLDSTRPPVLEIGENASLSEDGQSCRADLCGYAVLLEGRVAVLPPIWVSKDLLCACFVRLGDAEKMPALAGEEIAALLEQAGIVHGILEEAIGLLCSRSAKKWERIGRLMPIARGTEAVPGRDAVWEFACDPELTRYHAEIARVFARSRRVEQLVTSCEGLAARVVSAGERLASKQPPAAGEIGRDVFGEEFMPEEPVDVELEEGEHVALSDDRMSCRAQIFGYLGIDRKRNRVRVIPPIWLSRDRMTAYFIALPQLGEKRVPTPEEIERLLQQAGVVYGIDHEQVAVLCEKVKQGLPVESAVPLARGKVAQIGEDGRFDFAVDRERKPGAFHEDGSIDFKQLNLAPLLKEGQSIGSRIVATQGSPGTDISGRPLPTRDGEEVEVDVGRNIRLVRRRGKPDRYLSEIEGELLVLERPGRIPPLVHLEVHPTMVVEGDVDYETGHIDFPGSVHIAGSIRPGFTVKAEGNVVVGDSVEEGARVVAGGNLAVRNGITGERTRVTVAGSVFAKYINAAGVRARVDLHISEYIFNASVRVGGEVVAWGRTGSRSSGVIAGGSVTARERIKASAIGSDASLPAQLIAGVDPGLLKQVADLQESIDRARAAIGKTLRSLEIERMPAERIRQVLLDLVIRARGKRRKILARSVKNLLALQERLEKDLAKKRRLEERMGRIAAKAVIEVDGSIVARTVIKIGGFTRVMGTEGAQVTNLHFSLAKNKKGDLLLQMAGE